MTRGSQTSMKRPLFQPQSQLRASQYLASTSRHVRERALRSFQSPVFASSLLKPNGSEMTCHCFRQLMCCGYTHVAMENCRNLHTCTKPHTHSFILSSHWHLALTSLPSVIYFALSLMCCFLPFLSVKSLAALFCSTHAHLNLPNSSRSIIQATPLPIHCVGLAIFKHTGKLAASLSLGEPSLLSTLSRSFRYDGLALPVRCGEGAQTYPAGICCLPSQGTSWRVGTRPKVVQWDGTLDFSQDDLLVVPAEPWGHEPRTQEANRAKGHLRTKPTQKKAEPSVCFLTAVLDPVDSVMPEDWALPHPPLLSFLNQAISFLAKSQTKLDSCHQVTISRVSLRHQ